MNVNNGEQAGLTSWFDPEGPSPKDLKILKIETREGKPLALMVNYASHGEVMFRPVSKDGGYEASGDLPGATMRLLFKPYSPAIATLPASDLGAHGWGLVNAQARRLAAGVIDTLAKGGVTQDQAHLYTAMGSVS